MSTDTTPADSSRRLRILIIVAAAVLLPSCAGASCFVGWLVRGPAGAAVPFVQGGKDKAEANGAPDGEGSVVGKWEYASQLVHGVLSSRGAVIEFKNDGTGYFVIQGAPNSHTPFKWHITKEKKPVLVIDPEKKTTIIVPLPFWMLTEKNQSHFKREGDTLTIVQLQQAPAGVSSDLVLRKTN